MTYPNNLSRLEEISLPEFVCLSEGKVDGTRLVCFHFAGGSAQSFMPWREIFAGKHELFAAELPGRSRRYSETFIESIEVAVNRFADAFRQLECKPTVFYGHSLGAILAYETARRLDKTPYQIEHLILSSRSSPVNYPSSIGLPKLTDRELLEYLKELNGTDAQVLNNKKLMDVILPVIRSDLEIIYDYEHKPTQKLTVSLDIIGAIDDQHCPFETLLDWRNITSAPADLYMIDGDHFAPMNNAAHILNLIEQRTALHQNPRTALR
ncbi:MAG: thioesterase domain-containing protein [Pseudomonadota bacterium]